MTKAELIDQIAEKLLVKKKDVTPIESLVKKADAKDAK